eukprot:scaffold2639_cov361-Pavlova_lutheri.AAC.21
MTAPVSNFAGLDPPDWVSPRSPGSVSTTSSTTVLGRSTPITCTPYGSTVPRGQKRQLLSEAVPPLGRSNHSLTFSFQTSTSHSMPSLRYLAQDSSRGSLVSSYVVMSIKTYCEENRRSIPGQFLCMPRPPRIQ